MGIYRRYLRDEKHDFNDRVKNLTIGDYRGM